MKSGKKEKDEVEKKPEAVVEGYRKRLGLLKKAQEFSRSDDFPKAVQHYNLYLNALARFHGVKEEDLKPKYFDEKQEITELLLISHAYWDLAKAYDRSPKLQYESLRCLNQFVAFSSGFKFQHVNAQMLRKFIRKGQAYNPKAFKEAFEKIHTKSKGCYISTYCFHESHLVTNNAREFRDYISKYFLGKFFINQYYRFSPGLVDLAKKYSLLSMILIITLKPLIYMTTSAFKKYAHFKKIIIN